MADKPEQETDQEVEQTADQDSVAEETAVEDEKAQPDAVDAESRPDDGEDEVTRLREALLRTRAEMDNLHKRTERELARSRRFALEGVMRDLLPVLDSLDQGLQAESEAGGDGRQGLELTRKLLLQTLTGHGLEVLEPEGQPFDPEVHEAMAAQPSTEAEPDTVLQVLQKGYRLNERLLRPARVIVATATDPGE